MRHRFCSGLWVLRQVPRRLTDLSEFPEQRPFYEDMGKNARASAAKDQKYHPDSNWDRQLAPPGETDPGHGGNDHKVGQIDRIRSVEKDKPVRDGPFAPALFLCCSE